MHTELRLHHIHDSEEDVKPQAKRMDSLQVSEVGQETAMHILPPPNMAVEGHTHTHRTEWSMYETSCDATLLSMVTDSFLGQPHAPGLFGHQHLNTWQSCTATSPAPPPHCVACSQRQLSDVQKQRAAPSVPPENLIVPQVMWTEGCRPNSGVRTQTPANFVARLPCSTKNTRQR